MRWKLFAKLGNKTGLSIWAGILIPVAVACLVIVTQLSFFALQPKTAQASWWDFSWVKAMFSKAAGPEDCRGTSNPFWNPDEQRCQQYSPSYDWGACPNGIDSPGDGCQDTSGGTNTNPTTPIRGPIRSNPPDRDPNANPSPTCPTVSHGSFVPGTNCGIIQCDPGYATNSDGNCVAHNCGDGVPDASGRCSCTPPARLGEDGVCVSVINSSGRCNNGANNPPSCRETCESPEQTYCRERDRCQDEPCTRTTPRTGGGSCTVPHESGNGAIRCGSQFWDQNWDDDNDPSNGVPGRCQDDCPAPSGSRSGGVVGNPDILGCGAGVTAGGGACTCGAGAEIRPGGTVCTCKPGFDTVSVADSVTCVAHGGQTCPRGYTGRDCHLCTDQEIRDGAYGCPTDGDLLGVRCREDEWPTYTRIGNRTVVTGCGRGCGPGEFRPIATNVCAYICDDSSHPLYERLCVKRGVPACGPNSTLKVHTCECDSGFAVQANADGSWEGAICKKICTWPEVPSVDGKSCVSTLICGSGYIPKQDTQTNTPVCSLCTQADIDNEVPGCPPKGSSPGVQCNPGEIPEFVTRNGQSIVIGCAAACGPGSIRPAPGFACRYICDDRSHPAYRFVCNGTEPECGWNSHREGSSCVCDSGFAVQPNADGSWTNAFCQRLCQWPEVPDPNTYGSVCVLPSSGDTAPRTTNSRSQPDPLVIPPPSKREFDNPNGTRLRGPIPPSMKECRSRKAVFDGQDKYGVAYYLCVSQDTSGENVARDPLE